MKRLVIALVPLAMLVSGCAVGFHGTPTDVTATRATVNGVVFSTVSGETSYWVEYGETSAHGSESVHRSLTIADDDGYPVSVPLSGLTPATLYHYRLCAKDSDEKAGKGCDDDTFTTGPLKVSAQPALYPEFNPAVSDYVTRCGSDPVNLSVSAPTGTTVAVDGDAGRSGQFTDQVSLQTGQSFQLESTSTSTSKTYRVRCLPSDFPAWSFTRSEQPTLDYALVAPSLSLSGTKPYLAFFDAYGVPVWWYRASRPPSDAKLLANGTVAFAFASLGYAAGPGSDYQIRRLNGTLVRTISTVGSFTDDHDLQVLANGNYLLETYKPRDHVDLSAFGGPSDATVVDGEIQELTPNGALVWSWNTKDHISLSETGRWWPTVLSSQVTLPDGRVAYDPVHINSIEVDGGSLVTSLRHTDGVYRIARSDGDIEWKLGGTTTSRSLDVEGDPNASPLGGQHDPRVLADGTITVHDNRTQLGGAPRAVRYRIDTTANTATLVESLSDPDVPVSFCCGSARKLASNGWLVNWGGQPVVAEYKADGTRLSKLAFNSFFSYRAFPVETGTITATALRGGMDAMFPR